MAPVFLLSSFVHKATPLGLAQRGRLYLVVQKKSGQHSPVNLGTITVLSLPGPRLQTERVFIRDDQSQVHTIWSTRQACKYLVIRLSETTTELSEYSKSEDRTAMPRVSSHHRKVCHSGCGDAPCTRKGCTLGCDVSGCFSSFAAFAASEPGVHTTTAWARERSEMHCWCAYVTRNPTHQRKSCRRTCSALYSGAQAPV